MLKSNLAILAILFLVFASSSLQSEEETSNSAQIKKFLPQACFLSGKFQQSKIIADLPLPLTSNGSFLFSCENGLIWNTEEPIQETLVYKTRGKPLRVAANGGEEVLSGRAQREIGAILNNLIGAKVEPLQKTFMMTFEVDTLILEPKRKQFRKFLSAISVTKSESAVEIEMQSKAEQTDISISNLNELPALTSQLCQNSAASAACDWLFE